MRRVVCAATLALSGSTFTVAQAAVASPQLPPVYDVNSTAWVDDADPRSWASIQAEFATVMDEGGWFIVLEELGTRFKSKPWSNATFANAPVFKAAFDAHLDSFLAPLIASGLKHEWSMTSTRADRAAVLKAGATDVSWYTENARNGNAGFFRTDSGFEVLTVTGGGTSALDQEYVEDGRYLIRAFSRIIDQYLTGPQRNRAVAKWELGTARWQDFLGSGYSMLPWESWLNGRVGKFDILNPPTSQWILMHPGLGVEFSTGDGLDEARAKEVLAVELFGQIYYDSNDYQRYKGWSLLATVREDVGIGLGALMHLGRNMHFGVTWRDGDDDGDWFDDDPFVMLSIDLYAYAGRQRQRANLLAGANQ